MGIVCVTKIFLRRGWMEKVLYTVGEVSKLLSMKESRIRQAVFRREINFVKIGALVRFRLEDIERFIKDNIIYRVQS